MNVWVMAMVAAVWWTFLVLSIGMALGARAERSRRDKDDTDPTAYDQMSDDDPRVPRKPHYYDDITGCP